MPKLLVVDDEPLTLQQFRRAFEKHGVEVLTAETAAESLKIVREQRPDAAIFDLMLPDMSGIELLKEVQKFDSKLPVVFLTAGGSSATAIEAMQLGAFDYLLKPPDFKQVRELIDRAFHVRRLMNEPVNVGDAVDPADSQSSEVLVGRSEAMQEIYKAIGRVAPKNVNVLIRGESGTGKELVARAIYQYSDRAAKPFLAVNCAAIPEALLESELFGHEKGAFTGADRRRIGKFEQCNGGTIFMDEIGDMPLALQSKMLRLLQDQRFERVGSNQTIQTDVRIITATHRDLEQMADEGKFRWDLYYRLNVYCIEIPPLRERLHDLPMLVEHFLNRANAELQKEVREVDDEAMALLEQYSWPGNVRELQSVLKQAVLQTTGPVLLPEFLPDPVTDPAPHSNSHSANRSSVDTQTVRDVWDRFVAERLDSGRQNIYTDAVELTEREVISRVLRHTGGNQVQTAKLLGISRSTLRTRIETLGIRVGHVVETDGDS